MTKTLKSAKLEQALLSAFDQEGFEKVFLETLQRKFSYVEMVSFVAKSANAGGWSTDLVNIALCKNPENSILRQVALLDPLAAIIAKPPNKSTASSDEVERVLICLIQILESIHPAELPSKIFDTLDNCLEDLYSEYNERVAATIG